MSRCTGAIKTIRWTTYTPRMQRTEWLNMTRPTRAELLELGGAPFSAIRRLPFFEFSTEEIVAAMVGRAAVRGKPCEALQCCACGAHVDWADDGTLGGFEEEYIEDGFNVIIRDSRCTICYICLSGIWMDGGPLNSFLRGEIICPMCNRVYSNGLACGDDMAKVFRISQQGIKVEPGG
jgi:hypothetical protein